MRAPRTYGTQRTEMTSRLRHDKETDQEPISTSARYRRSSKSMPIPNAHRILVIGAWVGGISIARGLLRDGHDVTVFERRPDMRPGGGAALIWTGTPNRRRASSTRWSSLEPIGTQYPGVSFWKRPAGATHLEYRRHRMPAGAPSMTIVRHVRSSSSFRRSQ